ncbi:hypothetical protein EYC80_003801 [Monilinia laxa]|uniref:Uncharacterized protein n=1 Tax=Monilinia laxa TaxID=61186 RepID=A0A5N6KL42_MONLA|nr:hypothetical protein EYC80_003801 [Monilinia laxa]
MEVSISISTLTLTSIVYQVQDKVNGKLQGKVRIQIRVKVNESLAQCNPKSKPTHLLTSLCLPTFPRRVDYSYRNKDMIEKPPESQIGDTLYSVSERDEKDEQTMISGMMDVRYRSLIKRGGMERLWK